MMQHWTVTETERLVAEADLRARREAAAKAERRAETLRRIDEQMLRSRFQPPKVDWTPWVMTAALIVFAVIAIGGGWVLL